MSSVGNAPLTKDSWRDDGAVEPSLAGCVRWFDHPLFAGVAADRDFFLSGDLGDFNAGLADTEKTQPLRFVAQTPELFADGLHYEDRIARRGLIATRMSNTHDRFNALIWLRHAALKRAMNARQVADIARVGPKQRTRAQCALTHFDEAGAIVWLDGNEWLDAWDAHDWPRLFARHRDAWGERIAVTVIGHALFDYALTHDELPVAKALAVVVDREAIAARSRAAHIASWVPGEKAIAQAIGSGSCLADPQELRPLPLAGIPAWHPAQPSENFYATAPCFRPLRPGRTYPRPLSFVSARNADAQGSTRENAIGGALIG